MKRQRGFSLVELMIALGLASVVAAGLLALTRSQLIAYQQNEQISRTQQNVRAGMGYVENALRRACSGISSGLVYVNTPGVAPFTDQCVHHYDGVASTAGARFTAGSPASKSDAIEIVYGYGVMTAGTLTKATPSATVDDTTGFVVGELVLVTDEDLKEGALFKLNAKSAASGAGTLTFDVPGGASNVGTTIKDGTTKAVRVLRARSIALYVFDTANDPRTGALMLDPDGMAGTTHDEAEPLVENVDDFQLAIGTDDNADGVFIDVPNNTDDWLGNHVSDTPLTAPTSTTGWNTASGPKPKQIRAGLLVRTAITFPGALATVPGNLENRTFTPPAAANAGGMNPRWRTLRMNIAPRGWNLAE